MILIKRTEPPCACTTKLWDFYAVLADEGTTLGVGSVVECDCGAHYVLSESQYDGKFWKKIGRDTETVTIMAVSG